MWLATSAESHSQHIYIILLSSLSMADRYYVVEQLLMQ